MIQAEVTRLNTLTEALSGFPGISIEGAVQSDQVWQVLLDIEFSPEGWRSLEFIAWAAREMKKAGMAVMVEATAPAPFRNDPGTVLRFLIHGAEDVPEDSSAGRVAFFLSEWRKYYIPVGGI